MTRSAEAIFCIVNSGYEEKVFESANKIGITGGTFLGAHGLAKLDAEKFFGISIHPEKEIIIMVVPSDKKEKILKQLYDDVCLSAESQGIAFSMPVDDMTDNLKKQLFKK